MTERHTFTPRTQEALGRTLEATRNAMAQEEAIARHEKKLVEAYVVQDATSQALEAVKARVAKRVEWPHLGP